ncbi:uncharacterized protein ColSpa_01671 [Colletotrichum spaethianum]|uniref:Uncharacterized protein n=1 Tax=Colletotrichum spaethianum TaxID=700344 RepID=A0AA37L7C2_9PEZI|nr:uncharacterized protein ColSpa_01671 [Colletotrichum spaethianum]GKT41490.1 hypothetical protein ColSpa_01671 [Colletotrichum spaethianum]
MKDVAAHDTTSQRGRDHARKIANLPPNAEEVAEINALRRQPMPSTLNPLSQHSLAVIAVSPNHNASYSSHPLVLHSCFNKAFNSGKLLPCPTAKAALSSINLGSNNAGPCPSSVTGSRPSLIPSTTKASERAYQPVTSIPCQDPGSRYRPGRTMRIREKPFRPGSHAEATGVGSQGRVTAKSISSSGAEKETEMDVLAHEAAYINMLRRDQQLETSLGHRGNLQRNTSSRQHATGQGHQKCSASSSPSTVNHLPKSSLPRWISSDFLEKEGVSPHPKTVQTLHENESLEEFKYLTTQMDYYLHFNTPMKYHESFISTSSPRSPEPTNQDATPHGLRTASGRQLSLASRSAVTVAPIDIFGIHDAFGSPSPAKRTGDGPATARSRKRGRGEETESGYVLGGPGIQPHGSMQGSPSAKRRRSVAVAVAAKCVGADVGDAQNSGPNRV